MINKDTDWSYDLYLFSYKRLISNNKMINVMLVFKIHALIFRLFRVPQESEAQNYIIAFISFLQDEVYFTSFKRKN